MNMWRKLSKKEIAKFFPENIWAIEDYKDLRKKHTFPHWEDLMVEERIEHLAKVTDILLKKIEEATNER